jgi:hypothetical protein
MNWWQRMLDRRAGRFSYLLTLMLVQLVLAPWTEQGGARARIVGLLAGGAVLAALYTISGGHKVWVAGVILAVPAFLHRVTAPPDLRGFVSLVGLGSSTLFDVFITAFILQEILRHDDISAQTIYGALCAYLTCGYAFGHLYMLLQHVQPESFLLDARLFHHSAVTQPDLLYYSFTTLTALGANGISAAAPYARCFSMIEAILGVMYLTVLLGRLVGLHVSQRISRKIKS